VEVAHRLGTELVHELSRQNFTRSRV